MSKLGHHRRGSAWEFWFSPIGPLPVGVVFFPSLPSMGVMLFLSFVLGTVSGEGGTLFVPLFLFSPILPLSLLSSPSPSFSFSSPSHFPFLSHYLFLSFSLPSSSPSFSVSLSLFPFPLLLFSISFTFPFSFFFSSLEVFF